MPLRTMLTTYPQALLQSVMKSETKFDSFFGIIIFINIILIGVETGSECTYDGESVRGSCSFASAPRRMCDKECTRFL